MRPLSQFASYTGLAATFRTLSHDRWTEAGFLYFFGGSSMIRWFVVSPFLSESVASKNVCKSLSFLIPRLHHWSFLLKRFQKFLRYLVYTIVYFALIFSRNKFYFDLQMKVKYKTDLRRRNWAIAPCLQGSLLCLIFTNKIYFLANYDEILPWKRRAL